MKKIFFSIFAMTILLFASCTNDDINITTTPKVRTLTYVINTQNMYDELGITSELNSNYLSKGYSIGVYTFIYDSEGNKVSSKSSTSTNLSSYTEEFNLEEGAYTFVTYEMLIDNGYTPSVSGDDKLTTLAVEDRSSTDYHYVLGKKQTSITLKGGDQTASITPDATKVLLSMNINIQKMYDEFGITNDMTDKILRDKKAPIGIFVYIYNSLGELVDSAKTEQYTLNKTTLTRCLAKGDYTILSIETLIDPTTQKPDYWRFDDTQKLNTVKMSQIYSNPTKYNAVGTTNTNVNLTANKEISITNSAIGSMVNFYAFNFENTSYAQVGFGTTDILGHYSFNPQLQRDERFTENLSETGKFTTRGLKLTTEESASIYKIIYVLESKIDWAFAVQEDAEVNAWDFWKTGTTNLEDGKVYYAGFYYMYEDGEDIWFSTYFGFPDKFDSWIAETVRDINNHNSKTLFEQPYITWGGSVASVKSFMVDYKVGNNGNLIETDNGYVLWYNGKYKEEEIDYYFTSQTGGLTNAVVFFDAGKVGEDELQKAFSELGYQYKGSGDGFSVYSTNNPGTLVQLEINSQNYWVLIYYKQGSSARSNMPKSITKFDLLKKDSKSIQKSAKTSRRNVIETLRECESMMKLNSLK